MNWIRTDERTEAAKGLEFLAVAIKKAQADSYWWKWVIISLHNTLQAFIVCAISGTAGIGALKKKDAIKVYKMLESGSAEIIFPKLENFPDLYEKMKRDLNFSPGSSTDRAVEKLNEFRNKFIHFTPEGWSLEVDGLPGIAKNCLAIIEFLGWQPGHIHWYEEEMEEKAKLICKELNQELESMKATM